jgi:hypothetical protein
MRELQNITSRPRETRAPLSDMAMTCLAHCPDPDTVERMGRIFIDTANEMRAALVGGMGNA